MSRVSVVGELIVTLPSEPSPNSESIPTPFAPLVPFVPSVPCWPCGPCAPVAPVSPFGPCDPVGPVLPRGPRGPALPCGPLAPRRPRAPVMFQEIFSSPLGQVALADDRLSVRNRVVTHTYTLPPLVESTVPANPSVAAYETPPATATATQTAISVIALRRG